MSSRWVDVAISPLVSKYSRNMLVIQTVACHYGDHYLATCCKYIDGIVYNVSHVRWRLIFLNGTRQRWINHFWKLHSGLCQNLLMGQIRIVNSQINVFTILLFRSLAGCNVIIDCNYDRKTWYISHLVTVALACVARWHSYCSL